MTDPVDGGGPSSPSTGVIDGGTASGTSVAWVVDPTPVKSYALAVLRLGSGDLDSERIERLAKVAVDLVDNYLDRGAEQFTADAVPAAVLEAAATVCVELYKRKDAPFGIYGGWGQDGEVLRVGRDVLAGVEYLLMPYKRGWGLA